jgi:hypothetical protein
MTLRKRLLVLLVVLGNGCAAGIQYVPSVATPVAPPSRFVRLTVVEARPPGKGGDDPRQVGIVRGGYGNPMAFRQPDPNDVVRLVREASEDALRRAGVGVRADAPTEVVARVTRFWMDGYVGYGAEVEVEFLITQAGQLAFGTRAMGSASGVVLSFGRASGLLGEALAHMADQAALQFTTPPFQVALR